MLSACTSAHCHQLLQSCYCLIWAASCHIWEKDVTQWSEINVGKEANSTSISSAARSFYPALSLRPKEAFNFPVFYVSPFFIYRPRMPHKTVVQQSASTSSGSSLGSIDWHNVARHQHKIPRQHWLVDLHLSWIQTMKRAHHWWWAHAALCWAELCWALGCSSSMELQHDSSVLNTHLLSSQCEACLCSAESVSSSTWETSTLRI